MPSRKPRVPSYRLHKPSGQAVVTIGGRDRYLGPHGSELSRAEYNRLVAEWLTTGGTPPESRAIGEADLTVNEVMAAYLAFADAYYVKRGEPTTECRDIRYSLRPLRALYGHTLARDFGPLSLKAVRQRMIDDNLCRAETNKRTGRIVRAFKWAVENELVAPAVHHGLKAVSGLRRGRCGVRESEPVRPVADELVDAIKEFVSRQVWAMIELQRMTAMRPGEVVQIRTMDIDRSGEVWLYTPESHKTEHHGRGRIVPLGPRAQDVLRSWLREDAPSAWLFSPVEAEAERKATMRSRRKSRVQPSQVSRAKPKPSRKPGEAFTVNSYRQAITRGVA